MKKKHIGWIIVLILVALLALAVGGYFVATRVGGVELPALQAIEEKILGLVQGSEQTVYVQSVANILGVGYTGHSNRYSGVVEAKEVIEINPNSNLTIAERYVEAGDTVTQGMPLFSYDVDALTLSYEQLLIDITGLENSIRTANEEIESLEKRLERAKESQKYDLNLQLQEVQLTLKKSEYDLKSKQTQAEELEQVIADSVVKSPVAGRVRSVRSDEGGNPFGYGQESSNAYITIVAGSDYCVKGTVNEQTVRTLYPGMIVTIRSRTDETVAYRGEIYRVNTDEAVSERSGGYYYDGGSGDQSSKYAFYVSIDATDDLIMGEHVTIELGEPSEDDGKLWLPTYYFLPNETAGSTGYVWAADSKGRIEKRQVTLGAFNEDTESYEVVSGLGFTDRIAFPDETVTEGAPVSETLYAGEGDFDRYTNEDGEFYDPFGEMSEEEYSFEVPDYAMDDGDWDDAPMVGGDE